MKPNVGDTVEVERGTLLARHQLHIQRLPLAYILLDADFRIIDWNPSAERVFGYTKEQILGLGPPYEPIVPRHSWDKCKAICDQLRSGEMEVHSINENLTKDGRTITCQWFNTPLTADNGTFTGFFCMGQDITCQKKTEERNAVLSAKLNAMGSLVGVAHDVNNLLTVINGYSELLIGKLSPDDPMRDMLTEVRKAGGTAADLIGRLSGIQASLSASD